MQPLIPILAEVADKEFTVSTIVIWSLCAAGVGYGLTRINKWLVILAVLPAIHWAWLIIPEINDPYVGPSIVRELGYGYVILNYVSVLLPFCAICFALERRSSQLPKQTPRT